ncbi:MAG TPA: NAD(P)-dependent oxidoreductase, partial [Stellaceae bacterium]|nr:NAD(P)-dependent oxidoreductase [Stellaceae bacterium]
MSADKLKPGIAAGRLAPAEYAANFDDVHPPLTRNEALIEADRCYFCFDAPCIEACPTGIDIPGFIRRISDDNVIGAGVRILEANIMGGACARVCPTEILCEGACVRMAEEGKPIRIGALQRYATDPVLAAPTHPFTRAPASGKRVAVVGGGPAGLACAHRLSLLGHDIDLYEAKDRLGGLNEYGIAEYKVPHHFARSEVDFILGLGGITPHTGRALGRDLSLGSLRRSHDAVFLGLGLMGVKALQCEGEGLEGVHNAVDFIAALRQSPDFATLPVGRRVVVIGGGNTAIDIAVQTKLLGAEEVTLVYRRGEALMSATDHERDFARTKGVTIRYWGRPNALLGVDGKVRAVRFDHPAGESFTLEADMVMKAIGQVFIPDPLHDQGAELLALEKG